MSQARCLAFVTSIALLSTDAFGCASSSSTVLSSPAFRPMPKRSDRALTTSAAVEVAGDEHARALEAADGEYIGDLDLEMLPNQDALASVAASHGATHFRPITNAHGERAYVLLFWIAPARWAALPEVLRPRSL